MITVVSLALTVLCVASSQSTPPKVAIFPWSYSENERGTSESGVAKARLIIEKLWTERAACTLIDPVVSRNTWLSLTSNPWVETFEEPGQQAPVPPPKVLLEFGKAVGADYVCAGRVSWHVRSVWVGLGPKTKARALVDCRVIDVAKGEVLLDALEFSSDSTKAEKWYESAAALLVTWGVTLFSGGPKTPHIEKSAVLGVGGATEPFFATFRTKVKIGID